MEDAYLILWLALTPHLKFQLGLRKKEAPRSQRKASLIKGALINPHAALMRHFPTPSGSTQPCGFLPFMTSSGPKLTLQLYGTPAPPLRTDTVPPLPRGPLQASHGDATRVLLSS